MCTCMCVWVWVGVKCRHELPQEGRELLGGARGPDRVVPRRAGLESPPGEKEPLRHSIHHGLRVLGGWRLGWVCGGGVHIRERACVSRKIGCVASIDDARTRAYTQKERCLFFKRS